MRIKVLLSVGFFLCMFLLFLSGCGGSSSSATPPALSNELNVYGINVQVHTIPQVDMNRPFQVTAIISSLYPIASLNGVFIDSGHNPQAGSLDQLLRPPSYKSKKYALCVDVALQPDDPTAFTVDENTTPSIQELTLVPDVSLPQATSPKHLTATWNVTASDPGIAEVDHNIGVDVAFASHTFCGDNTLPLSGTSYHLARSANNTVKSATLRVVNPTLSNEEAIVNFRKSIAVPAIPILLTALLGWIFGLIPWIFNRVKSGLSQESTQNLPHPFTPPPSQTISGWRTATGIIGIAIGFAIFVVGFLVMWVGPATIAFFSTSFIVACIGFVIIIAAALLIKTRTDTTPIPSQN